MELGQAPALLETLEAKGPDAIVSGGTIEALFALTNKMDHALARSFVSFEERGEWGADGAQSAATWVRMVTRHSSGDVARIRRLGFAIRTMAITESAWAEGAISKTHVDKLAKLHKGRTKEAFERDEGLLVGFARDLSFCEFEQALDYWILHADPDGSEADATALHEGRYASDHQGFQGSWNGEWRLDPVNGEIVHNELARLEDELFEAEWAETKKRLGKEPTVDDLPRTRDQRRADALIEMAIRSASTPPGAQRPRPLVTVLMGYEHYARPVCELASGQVVTPGTVARHLDEADLERALFHSQRRVEISATSRLFTGATRRAVEVRDGKCRHPFCDRPAARCQVDHVIPFTKNGPTIRERGARGTDGPGNRGQGRESRGAEGPTEPSGARARRGRERGGQGLEEELEAWGRTQGDGLGVSSACAL